MEEVSRTRESQQHMTAVSITGSEIITARGLEVVWSLAKRSRCLRSQSFEHGRSAPHLRCATNMDQEYCL